MKAKIIDEVYLHSEEVRQYDKIVGDSMSYLYSIAEANDGIIFLKFDDYTSTKAKYLFKIARLCNTAATFPIFLNMKRGEYKQFKKENKTEYKVFRKWHNKKYIAANESTLLDFISDKNYECFSDDIFEKIYKEFWEIKEEFLDREIEFENTMTAIGEEEDV